MLLRVIKGLAEAGKETWRVDPSQVDSLPQSVEDRTVEVFGERLSPLQVVQRVLEDVRREGDDAVRRYAQLLDGAPPDPAWQVEVPAEHVARARDQVSAELVTALEMSAARVEEFHRATARRSWVDLSSGLGELVVPLERVGIYAPGGSATYPSTVLMTAIPARVAGVKEVVLSSPSGPSGDGDPDPALLVAADIAGVDRVFRVGGVQAIGAMAFGTASVPKVDKICGPGNVFVTLAKQMVYGSVDIDGLYGPTETVIVADETANPAFCAADLLAQAEHDPLAAPILVTTSHSLLDEVEAVLDSQIQGMERADMARASMEARGKAVLLDTMDDAIELANAIAPEHLCLMVEEPWHWAGKVTHAGGVFLGEFSPEVMGDYMAGPSHVMPTGGTARFNSALSVHHFLKTMPVVALKPADYPELARAAAVIARAEGMTGHARAVEIRLGAEQGNGAKAGD
ncbi:MAG: histidinol dehydrogenase [Dehalococcoidia bacterium]|nr:histidinol dehydrogenase [Dehalococcoidia bacterium]